MEGDKRPGDLLLVWIVMLAAGATWLYSRVRHGLFSGPGEAGHMSLSPAARAVEHLALALGLAAVVAAALVAGVVLGLRLHWRARRARSMRVDEIVLGPNDTAEPYEVMSALDAIHGQMLTRYVRSGVGQDPFAFEIVRTRDGMVHFLVSAPSHAQEWLRTLEDSLRAKYTNVRFRPWKDEFVRWPVAQQITLAKHWRHSTETVKDYQNSVVETVVQALDRAEGACHLQFLLTPLPSEALHHRLRSEIRGMERSAKAVQQVDPAAPGVGYAESQAVKDSLQLYGKSAFSVEIRLGAEDWGTMQRVYGALREANGENSFRASTVWALRGFWVRWLYARLPSLFLFRSSIMFSFPLATVIHLPTNRLRVNSLVRYYVRRAPAVRAIPREPSLETAMVLDDETGVPLAVPEWDREAGLIIAGAQGSGKTTDELSVFRTDVNHRDAEGRPKCVVLIDIGKDTSKRALGLVPPDRRVVYCAPGEPDCAFTINPLRASVNEAVMAENVLNAMQEVFGDQAIQWRSREFLGNAFNAVRDVLGDEADFVSAYRLLTDAAFRDDVIARVRDPHQQAYWQKTFVQAMASNPRFLEEGLAAPRNKLDELLRNPLVRATLSSGGGRRLLDLRAVIRDRAVLIVNLDKARLGDGGVRLLGIFLVTLLWYAMQAQNELDERDRVKVSLILDEAQNYLAEGFLNMLAEGRAYGLQVTLAIRFLAEIESPKVVDGLRQLMQNVILHQFQLLGEAQDFMLRFMRTYANMVQVNAESQDAISLGVDDILRLPKFTSICQWMVNGSVQPAFYARTINWEDFYREDWRRAHLEAQPKVVARDGYATSVGVAHEAAGRDPDREGALLLDPEAQPMAAASSRDVLSLVLGDDVADRLLAAAKDDLTGLFTRKVWEGAVAQAGGSGHVVAFVDLDDLKRVNDGPGGHAAGDALLRRAGEALRSVVRQGDLAVRLGGDEFALLAPDLAPEGVAPLETRVREAFERADVRASVGTALQAEGEVLAETIKRADEAMYADKRAHKRAHKGARAKAPHRIPPRPAAARTARDPAAWQNDDPRRVFSARFGVAPARLVQAAAETGASEDDLIRAAQWALGADLEPGVAMARLRRVLALKREDRLLRPVARRLGMSLNDLRKAVTARSLAAEDVARVARQTDGALRIAELLDHASARRGST